jgi:DnaJ-class molecular chaperone
MTERWTICHLCEGQGKWEKVAPRQATIHVVICSNCDGIGWVRTPAEQSKDDQ